MLTIGHSLIGTKLQDGGKIGNITKLDSFASDTHQRGTPERENET